MTSRTGNRNGNAARRRAFTLIELILVMALLLIVMGVAAPSLKNFFRGRTLDSEARRFLSLTRYAQSRAVSEGVPMTLWVDGGERTYGLQAQTGYMEDDRKAVEYGLDEDVEMQVSAPPATTILTPQKRTALLSGNLPAIRFSPDGFIDPTSPETVQFQQGEEHSIWITQSPNRLNYEITPNQPANFRR